MGADESEARQQGEASEAVSDNSLRWFTAGCLVGYAHVVLATDDVAVMAVSGAIPLVCCVALLLPRPKAKAGATAKQAEGGLP